MANRNQNSYGTDPHLPMILCVSAGGVLLAAFTLICFNTEIGHGYLGLILLAMYLTITIITSAVYFVKLSRVREAEEAAELVNTEVCDMFRHVIDVPYAIMDEDGVVKVVNDALRDILEFKDPVCNTGFDSICSTPYTEVINSIARADSLSGDMISSDSLFGQNEEKGGVTVTINGRRFRAECSNMRVRSRNFYFVVFHDITELLELREKMHTENTVVAYIILDNLQEIAQYVRVSYRVATNEIETILRNWAQSMNGVLREYERDKYLLLFSQGELKRCMDKKFEILDTIRSVKLGDNSSPVTISMGIAAIAGNMDERERAASAALDMAIQRGGDQVVVKSATGNTFFGGHVKTSSDRTAVRSRVNSNQLCTMIAEASNVLIMGHKNPDFDSFGACVGMARLALCASKSRNIPIKVVTDKRSDTVNICRQMLEPLDEYRNMFVDGDSAMDMVRSDTLLIIVDVNNQYIFEAPELANNIQKIAIIDHHILFSELKFDPILEYIQHDASSACELISEMIWQSPFYAMLTKEEANLMLAGIMLDTKNFTHNVKDSTFAAVQYLYDRQARTDTAGTLFSERPADLAISSEFGQNTRIYKENIAVTWIESGDSAYGDDIADVDIRVAASKAADKLLNIRNIDATFALVRSDRTVYISARSNGKINVQLILERLGGGGHFDMAGAQVASNTIEEVLSVLRAAIDEYLEDIQLRKNAKA